MILIGQYDSPFVRRVGITLTLYTLPYEHRPWSSFADADRIRALNPLGRVPTLILDDGTVLPDSVTILDYLDSQASTPLIPRSGPARLHSLRRAALALGVCDKAVSLVYEKVLHDTPSSVWMSRCRTQIAGVLAALETERAACPTRFWHGDSPGHDDIALGCAAAFLAGAHPGLMPPLPAITAHATRCEALPAFQAIHQPFVPPA